MNTTMTFILSHNIKTEYAQTVVCWSPTLFFLTVFIQNKFQKTLLKIKSKYIVDSKKIVYFNIQCNYIFLHETKSTFVCRLSVFFFFFLKEVLHWNMCHRNRRFKIPRHRGLLRREWRKVRFRKTVWIRLRFVSFTHRLCV